MGAVIGLADPVKVLSQLVSLGIDGTLMSSGIAKVTNHLLMRRDAPARTLTCEFPLLSVIPGEAGDPLDYDLVSTVENGLSGDFDAAKVTLGDIDKDCII